MPNKCCVPGCKGNYKSSNAKVSVFSFPKEEERAKEWLRKIHRVNYSVTKNSFVCERHFNERYIIREDCVTRKDGTVLSVKRQIPKLTEDAVPSIFDGQPSYMTEKVAQKRKTPATREEEITHKKKIVEEGLQEKDKIDDIGGNSVTHYFLTDG